MKHWVRMVDRQPAVLLRYDDLSVEANVGGTSRIFGRAEWEAFPAYSGPVEKPIINKLNPATWPRKPYLSVRNPLSNARATFIANNMENVVVQIVYAPIEDLLAADNKGRFIIENLRSPIDAAILATYEIDD